MVGTHTHRFHGLYNKQQRFGILLIDGSRSWGGLGRLAEGIYAIYAQPDVFVNLGGFGPTNREVDCSQLNP